MYKRLHRTSSLSLTGEVTIKPFLHQVIIGTTLGDLFIEKPGMKRNARLPARRP
jgi:hypothetical protein